MKHIENAEYFEPISIEEYIITIYITSERFSLCYSEQYFKQFSLRPWEEGKVSRADFGKYQI